MVLGIDKAVAESNILQNPMVMPVLEYSVPESVLLLLVGGVHGEASASARHSSVVGLKGDPLKGDPLKEDSIGVKIDKN